MHDSGLTVVECVFDSLYIKPVTFITFFFVHNTFIT